MAAAAEVIAWMEKRCGGGSYPQPATNVFPEDNLVCTTGSISLWPNTFNVVPGSANFTLDIRQASELFTRPAPNLSSSTCLDCKTASSPGEAHATICYLGPQKEAT